MVINMIVTANWLKKNINKKNIKVLDASWYLPNVNRDPKKEFFQKRIPKSVFFDIDDICDKKSLLPHMLPDKKLFENKVSDLGIKNKLIFIKNYLYFIYFIFLYFF